MSKTYEENTKYFYNELNGECDPERLLCIAEQGIFLKEPLFKYDKIKDHELKYFFMEEDYIYGKYCHLNCFLGKYSSLIIINKYFIDKLLYEKDKEFLEKVVNKSETEFYLLAVVPDMTFEIFKYFYSNTHKHLLEDLIKVNEDKIEDILIEILDVYGKDINILNYCLDKIKQYNLKIKDIRGYRVPMNHCFEILKYYSDKLCAKNNLYLKCEDKYAEEFINITFADSCLKNFDYLNETTRKTEYIYDIQSKLVNIIDPQYNGKLSYMLLIIIFLLLCTIFRGNCDLNNYGNEEISLLVLTAADSFGIIAKDQKGHYISVYNVDIIPELRRIYDRNCRRNGNCNTQRKFHDQQVNDYFKTNLYSSAVRTYKKYFPNNNNPNNKIKDYDLFGRLTIYSNDRSIQPINIFDPTIDIEILFPDNDEFYVIASYIRENDNYDEKTFNGIKYLNNKQTTNISFDVLHEIVKECINNKDSCKITLLIIKRMVEKFIMNLILIML
ncbi:hypothetical protein LY90DRAFT_678417 [Neocallimastix californiae]|uniref:Uncharacterized protein n=1 Tax=Neocallimastix californiae TaxID=1754190 RepID=A0A1Y1Z6R0_9FUNG|nr:hypothetical protein LY90DRAFT_678417 [Neocallimastix californiae]|eukprot:ORY05941.1 hypothetical protein LY90DRAFT_678417 [Neocallimastix californiae]